MGWDVLALSDQVGQEDENSMTTREPGASGTLTLSNIATLRRHQHSTSYTTVIGHSFAPVEHCITPIASVCMTYVKSHISTVNYP